MKCGSLRQELLREKYLQLFRGGGVYLSMKIENRYYRIAAIGLVLNLLLQVILFFAVDPYFASILSPLYSIWFILFIVGWRNEHPRR
ncbi:hypothetical protein [Pontibacter pamirensis]|uniref:hypothetical protein n=1 Tax=Pontibacter pamirensis TaxID=2562824 RepID=UPI00138A0F44|nr:hypothetical protein [Pontibacter pamirensis]